MFKRNKSLNSLELIHKVNLNFLPINLKYDSSTKLIYISGLASYLDPALYFSKEDEQNQMNIISQLKCTETICEHKNMIITNKINMVSSVIRIRDALISTSSRYTDGILICPANYT